MVKITRKTSRSRKTSRARKTSNRKSHKKVRRSQNGGHFEDLGKRWVHAFTAFEDSRASVVPQELFNILKSDRDEITEFMKSNVLTQYQKQYLLDEIELIDNHIIYLHKINIRTSELNRVQ